MNAISELKRAAKAIPVIGPALQALNRRCFRSASYWDRRYLDGGNSGAGSYGRLARYKADYINRFVKERRIKSVLELGCGDGAQLKLSKYPAYIGFDVSPAALSLSRKAVSRRRNYEIISKLGSRRAQLTLSLDVIYHLIEDRVFDAYMRDLFTRADRAVIIYSSNTEGRPVTHVRHRRFTDWIERNMPSAVLMHHEPNPFPEDPADPENTSFADFYIYAVDHEAWVTATLN